MNKIAGISKSFVFFVLLTCLASCLPDVQPPAFITGKHWKLYGYGESSNWASPYPSLNTYADYQGQNCMVDLVRFYFQPNSNQFDLYNPCDSHNGWSPATFMNSFNSLYWNVQPRRTVVNESLTYEMQNNGSHIQITRHFAESGQTYTSITGYDVTYDSGGSWMQWHKVSGSDTQDIYFVIDTSVPAN